MDAEMAIGDDELALPAVEGDAGGFLRDSERAVGGRDGKCEADVIAANYRIRHVWSQGELEETYVEVESACRAM